TLEALIAKELGCDAGNVYDALESLLDRIIPRKPLSAYGMTDPEADSFAKDVDELQQRLLNQSYVKFDIPTMAAIYRKLL
ncbi:MAG: 4-hydroxybutyrate dehydrogenase, partial [Clostridia bacterium]|nr:4-hydroxybutyrate dehydrogenase [Clostridia bacterium]